MTSVLETRHSSESDGVKPGQVAGQLAKIEARRTALHPATLVGLALTLWAMWGLNTGQAPVLNRAGTNVVLPLVLLAGGALIAASDAAIRIWNTQQSEAIDVTAASQRTRTAALLLGCSAPVVIGFTLQLIVLAWMMSNDPVTSLDWWELLAGTATVALGVSAGVAAVRWVPSRFSGPLALVALIGASVYLSLYDTAEQFGQPVRWLTPIVPLELDPTELTFRASGVHLVYLFGLVLFFVSISLLRGKTRRLLVPMVVFVISLATVAGGAREQARAYESFDYDERLQALLPPNADYVCERDRYATYCAYPGYEPWIAEWAALVEPVLELAPEHVQIRSLNVTQYPTRALDILLNGSDLEIEYEPGLATGMWWGRRVGTDGASWGDAYPYGMALGAAAWAVGLQLEPVAGTWELVSDHEPPRFVPGTEGVPPDQIAYQACDTGDQGRAVVALWMAAQASPVTEQHLLDQIEKPRNAIFETFEDETGGEFTVYNLRDTIGVGQPYSWYALEFHKREAYYAYRLLDQPRRHVVDTVQQSWTMLTDPDTSTLEALDILGVEALAEYERQDNGQPFEMSPPCA